MKNKLLMTALCLALAAVLSACTHSQYEGRKAASEPAIVVDEEILRPAPDPSTPGEVKPATADELLADAEGMQFKPAPVPQHVIDQAQKQKIADPRPVYLYPGYHNPFYYHPRWGIRPHYHNLHHHNNIGIGTYFRF